MIFRKAETKEKPPGEAGPEPDINPTLLVVCSAAEIGSPGYQDAVRKAVAPWDVSFTGAEEIEHSWNRSVRAVLSVFQSRSTLSSLLGRLRKERQSGIPGFPILIIAADVSQITEFGAWLYENAVQDTLQGIRLIAASRPAEIPDQLPDKLAPVVEPNVIKMPTTPEVETTSYKYFYSISPQLRQVTTLMRDLAQNNIYRIYLLGGPGTGKTTLAYYYWLCRGKGRFVAVNLTAESTGDKTAMKSLLCGHVAGSCGPHSREGAFAFAEDGVCFLDESHGVTGVVMQVLMEVLDSGQYLQFGATKKRTLECAVIFASNRSWDTLRNQMHLDEYARLGTTIVSINDLCKRSEDLIAVLATALSKFACDCTSWTPPKGIAPEAWQMILSCPWKGNLRTLIRVAESSAIAFAMDKTADGLIEKRHVLEALSLWEPQEHDSLKLYGSFA